MTVIPVDFGMDARKSARAFARLMKLSAELDADILSHPGKYLDMASKRLAEAERFASDLYNALHTPWMASASMSAEPPKMIPPDTIQVDRRDYEALQALKKLIND